MDKIFIYKAAKLFLVMDKIFIILSLLGAGVFFLSGKFDTGLAFIIAFIGWWNSHSNGKLICRLTENHEKQP